MQSNAERKLTDRADVRHLLRRLAFAATESLESAVTGLTVGQAVDVLVNGAKRAPRPAPPPFVLTEWTNTALLFTDTTAVEYQQAFAGQDAAAQADIERLRHWWLQEMVAGEAPLRENLVLFLHGTLGSTTGSVNMPQALHARNDRLRTSGGSIHASCPGQPASPKPGVRNSSTSRRRVRQRMPPRVLGRRFDASWRPPSTSWREASTKGRRKGHDRTEPSRDVEAVRVDADAAAFRRRERSGGRRRPGGVGLRRPSRRGGAPPGGGNAPP